MLNVLFADVSFGYVLPLHQFSTLLSLPLANTPTHRIAYMKKKKQRNGAKPNASVCLCGGKYTIDCPALVLV